MSDFAPTYALCRGRYMDALKGLTQAQLNFRIYPDTLTIGEMSLHLAGVEYWFIKQLKQEDIIGEELRLTKAAVDGVINSNPFPYGEDEITPEKVLWAMNLAQAEVESVIDDPTPFKDVQIVSALGPVIDGTGTFARIAFHPGYHLGQIYMIKCAPGFPEGSAGAA